MFRFRTLDLFLITAVVAIVAGVQQVELAFFRQLFWFSLVSLFSTAAVVALSMIPHKRVLGGFGGFMAGCIYFAVTVDFENWMFDSTEWLSGTRQSTNSIQESLLVFVLSFPLGAATGPLIAIHFREIGLPKEFNKPIRWSLALLGGTFLVGFFTMLDRLKHETRDWTILLCILFIAFVVYTLAWLKRVEFVDNPLKVDSQSEKLDSQ